MLHSLYLDLNSFFASCEQQARPELRGRPVAVVPLMADSTCAIAASYQAKAFGIRTGTRVGDAKRMCPGLQLVQASHKRYVEYHHRVLEAIDHIIPVEQVRSIDEVTCKLTADQQQPEVALDLGRAIKRRIAQDVGECLTSSIGIASNPFLAKIASNMQKPDGLIVLTPEMLPQALWKLDLRAIPGMGPRMERRLNRCGVWDVETLTGLDSLRMRAIWGGVGGARFHAQLHGMHIGEFPSEPSVLGHQHVLEPALRNAAGAHATLQRLLAKAAERLRAKGYYCRRLSVHLKLTGHQGYETGERKFTETQDTAKLLAELDAIWREFPEVRPLRVGISLSGLVPATAHQLDLFEHPTRYKALTAVDDINLRYGRGTISFGLGEKRLDTDKIAFQRVPKLHEVS